MEKRVEILAPAGSYSALISAIFSGCDAVYLGAEVFNARIRAENFTLDTMPQAISLAHAHGVKIYITLNTSLYEKELTQALEYVRVLWNMGADAFIVADFGVISLIHSLYPQIELHASTQCTVHNLDGANFLSRTLGVSRVVLARELSKENIEYISKNAECETEIFVHGAHCMSVSGQCLFSYFLGGRSGNRGECAQPCRLPYQINGKKMFPLSLKDMTLSSHITELLKSGVASLKIEGRMKGSDYVGGTVKIWRELIDQRRNASKQENETLSRLFSRQGFTDGYYKARIDSSMLGVRTEENKAQTNSNDSVVYQLKKPRVRLFGSFIIGKKASLTITWGEKTATAYGDIVEEAINAPISREDIIKSLSKLGTTPFELENIEIEKSESIMVRVSSLNALRREAVSKLLLDRVPLEPVEIKKAKPFIPSKKIRTALFNCYEQIPKNADYFDVIFLPLDRYKRSTLVNGISMPPVIFDNEWDTVEGLLSKCKEDGVEYALLSNIGQAEKVKKYGFKLIFDYRFNVFNGHSINYLANLGAENIILSPELSLPQLRDYKSLLVIAYGKVPLMTTHKCVIKDTVGCDKCKTYIEDRQGARFFVEGTFGHRNIIYNSVPFYMADKLNEINALSHHFIFSDEKRDECEAIIEAYKSKKAPKGGFKRIK